MPIIRFLALVSAVLSVGLFAHENGMADAYLAANAVLGFLLALMPND